MTAHQILTRYFANLISAVEATVQLDILQIRGAFDASGFTGYDYANQCWISREA